MKQKFYDSDIMTDNPPSDLHSDRNLPKDKLFKKKLIYKEELFRVYREIRSSGESYHKPASYDETTFKMIKLDSEDADENQVTQSESRTVNIGMMENDPKWLEISLTKMKKGEICKIYIEHLKFDQNELKIMDYMEYYSLQMVDWVILIDLYQNFNYMKRVLQKSPHNQRMELTDEVKIKVSLKQGDKLLYSYESSQLEVLKIDQVSRNLTMMLKTMKLDEHAIITIKQQSFIENETQEFLSTLGNYTEEDWQLDIHLLEMYKMDDIFSDGILIKKQINKPNSSAKPEKVSYIQFDLWIYACDTEQYSPQQPTQCIYNSTNYLPHDLSEEERNPSLKLYIDDPDISKLLKNALLRTKKQELALFYCGNVPELVRKENFDGKLMKPLPKRIYYYIKVYDFTEGKNNFTMNIDEKIEQAIRKKQHGLDYIKVQNYKKALKVFKTINAYFDYGSFSEEDKEKMRQYKLSSLLNTTLCQLKLKQWKELIGVADKVLEMEANSKGVYRKCIGLQGLQEYEQALQTINKYQQFGEDLGKLKKEIENQLQKYEKTQKKVYQKMFE